MRHLLWAGALALALSSCQPAYAQAVDPFASNFDTVTGPCRSWASIVPSDTTDLPMVPKAIYVGGAGDIAMIGVRAPDGATGVTWKAANAGSIIPARPRRVLATGTTATSLLACF